MSVEAVDLHASGVRLADRARLGRSEADVQSDVRTLLLAGGLELRDEDLLVPQLEAPAGEGRRIDIELGFTVIEVKRSLLTAGVRQRAEPQLAGYLRQRQAETGQRYVGILTDGADWLLFYLAPDDALREVSALLRAPGANPVGQLLPSERPKPSQAPRRRISEGEQVAQTIAAAHEPHRTLLTVAALTGARVSELCAMTWADVRLDDLDDAEVAFTAQVDRQGNRRATKTDGSARVVPSPRQLAAVLARHKLASRHTQPDAFVFATRTGRPLAQRNVMRALRQAQARAVTPEGTPTFPILHERDERGQPVPVPRGAVPSMHSFRHTYASRWLLAGESVDEVAFLLGHRDGNVTRAVYVHEVADARRRATRRSRMTAEYGSALEAAAAPIAPAGTGTEAANVRQLRRSS